MLVEVPSPGRALRRTITPSTGADDAGIDLGLLHLQAFLGQRKALGGDGDLHGGDRGGAPGLVDLPPGQGIGAGQRRKAGSVVGGIAGPQLCQVQLRAGLPDLGARDVQLHLRRLVIEPCQLLPGGDVIALLDQHRLDQPLALRRQPHQAVRGLDHAARDRDPLACRLFERRRPAILRTGRAGREEDAQQKDHEQAQGKGVFHRATSVSMRSIRPARM
nr:hypothetical protein [Paracoccus contaminans]